MCTVDIYFCNSSHDHFRPARKLSEEEYVLISSPISALLEQDVGIERWGVGNDDDDDEIL